MKKLLVITMLALSGCARLEQARTPATPEQVAAMTAYNAEIDNANAERERNRIAEEAAQLQYRASVQQAIQSNMPRMQTAPATQFGQPLYVRPLY